MAHPFLLREPRRALVFLDLVWKTASFFLYLVSLLLFRAWLLLGGIPSLARSLGGEQARQKWVHFWFELTMVWVTGGCMGEGLAQQ